jgi:MoaA/NifB/PqqE/SkfB family radical SAM enzyme
MGGEPTLRPDFVKIVEFCSKNKMYTQLPTNGMFLINPLRTVKGKTLLEQLVSAGLCVLNLSVDSVVSGFKASEKELPKTQAILNALIEQKEKRGLVIMLNCVITKKNIMQVPQMLEFCHSKSLSMAAIFAQDPNPSNSPQMVRVPKGILFSKSDYSEVEKTVDYLISKKKSGYQLIEPIEYYASVKDWINGRLNWQCEGGLSSLNIDTDGKVGICGYLPYIGVNIKDSKEVIYRAVNRAREKYLTWCTQKCIPSCMYCSAYFRHHPLSLLYNKIRYL